MHRGPQHHFLSYTIEHILGAFFVISTAMFVGYAAYASDIASSTADAGGVGVNVLTPPLLAVPTVGAGKVSLAWTGVSTEGNVAQGFAVFRNDAAIATLTVPSYNDTTGLTPGATYVYYIKTIDTSGNSSLASNKVSVTIPLGGGGAAITPVVDTAAKNLLSSPVTFGVTIAPIVDCVTGKPMNEVFFVTSDDAGGAFTISSDGGIKNAPLEWGRYPLPNGTYSWNAVVKNGYVGEGVLSGSFELHGSCPTPRTESTSSPAMSIGGGEKNPTLNTFPLKYPENVSIVPTITVDHLQIKEGGTATGVVTFHVVAHGSTRTVFVLEGALGVKQYIDKQLGVIHKDGTDEWSTLWNTANLENGTYTLAALMDTTSGTIISKKISFVVKNTSGTNGQNGIKPVLKVFLNNNAVASGAILNGKDPVEFRVSVPSAKKVSFYAVLPTGTSPLSLATGVVDDLLSNKEQDVWTASWDGGSANPGSYKIFARVLYLDGSISESALFPLVVLEKNGGNVTTSVLVTSSSSATPILDKEAILNRVTSPQECGTQDECKIFCSSRASSTLSCLLYARTVIERGDDHASLASGIDHESIVRVLSDPRKRSDIPLLVNDADDLLQFCANPAHADNCIKTFIKNDLASSSVLEEKKKAVLAARDTESAVLLERTPARAFFDSDKDGISDYDEMNIYHTDPSQDDSDGDGTPDNVEITQHTNPHGALKKSTGSTTSENGKSSEGVSFEDPLIAGVVNSNMLSVSNIQVAEVGIGEDGTTTAKKLFLSGKALPNSYVTLYIFSTPVLITIKTDYSGTWSYTLDKELENGAHQAVVAVTDERGHILAKSDTLPFVKSAGLVSIGVDSGIPTHKTTGTTIAPSVYIAIIIGLIGLIVSVFGFLMHRKEEKDGPLFPVSKGK